MKWTQLQLQLKNQYNIDIPIIEYKGKIFRSIIRREQSYLTGAGKINLEHSLYRADIMFLYKRAAQGE